MTTVRDIQSGNYCENCSIDCIRWALGSDCCVVDTTIGRVYSEVYPEHLNEEMKYEVKT